MIRTQSADGNQLAVFLSTGGPGYSARLAFGWRVANLFYVGPEVAGFAHGDSYNQIRVGLHVTGVKPDDLECSVAFGWSFDSRDVTTSKDAWESMSANDLIERAAKTRDRDCHCHQHQQA